MRLTLVLFALLFAVLAPPALAASTARATADLPAYAGPGRHYARIGLLRDGTEVTLRSCTRDQRWCDADNYGWVDATYLIGVAAKERVTPPTLLLLPDWDTRFWRRYGRNTCEGFPYDPWC